MFITFKKRSLIIFLCAIILVAGVVVYFTAIKPTFQPKPEHVIVIDAGHGGIDGGATGVKTGIEESALNLEYAECLKDICQQFGYHVVMTRSDMNGLYDVNAPNKKKSEMETRRRIIEKANADVVVSLHMNSFPLPSAHGAQVYYAKGSESGKSLAGSVSKTLHDNFENAKLTAKVGDFFVLNTTSSPAILVECGFLSNPEEEALLIDDDYMHSFCLQIFYGIIQFQKFQ